jgi:hypothetical protein
VALNLISILGEKTINRTLGSYISVEKLKYLSIAISCTGLLFKGNHWPYASIITTIGFIAIIVYCLIKIFKA